MQHQRQRKMVLAGLVFISCVWVGLLGACAPEPVIDSGAGSASPTLFITPEISTEADSLVMPTPDAMTPQSAACQPDEMVSSVQYDIRAVLDWTQHTVQVQQTATYRNETTQAQETLVFNVDVNQAPENFILKRITDPSGEQIENYTLEGTVLIVELDDSLPPQCAVELVLEYELVVPEIQGGYRNGHVGYWGYSPRQINLGMWFPLIAVFDAQQGWITPQTHWLGEHFVLRTADFVVELSVKNAPDGLRVAGPGKASHPDKQTWRFELTGARDVTLSISNEFRVLSTSTADGVEVELFYFPGDESEKLDTPRHVLYMAADALALYAELYGPYPQARMVVVQGDFPDGMEFSGLVFIGEAWFRNWKHVPNDWLTIITVHEVAHQWWYALVGNDQGQYPYLDEALAIYSEVLFFERYYPEYLDWWWDFRVGSYAPTGYVDAPVYEFYSPRGYINAVYLRGALMMRSLREDVGDDTFLAWLREYSDQMQGQVAAPDDFWGVLTLENYLTTEDTRLGYLQQHDVVPVSVSIP